MMDRQRLKASWERYYRVKGTATLQERTSALEARMRALGRLSQAEYHGFNLRKLQGALGMAYGVHKQVLRGLHPRPGGCILEGGRGGIDLQIRG